jgi:hypothetical protein
MPKGAGSKDEALPVEALPGVHGPFEALEISNAFIDFPPPGGTLAHTKWHQRIDPISPKKQKARREALDH